MIPLIAALLLTSSSEAGVIPYPIVSQTLDNGLTVHVVPMESHEVVAYYAWMNVGSRDEVEKGRTGFAHFFEHLMFYGSKTLDRTARERELLRIGADDNAWTWLDETVYRTVVSSSGLPELIRIEADRFLNLHLTEQMVQKEAGAVYGEFRKSRSSPGERLSDALYSTAFGVHTYGHSTLGLERDIAAMPGSLEAAKSFFQRYYQPQNATILVVGDVEPDSVFEEIQSAYGGWRPVEMEPLEIPVEPEQTEARRVTVEWGAPTAARVAIGWKIPGQNPGNADIAALQVLEDTLLSSVGPLDRRLIKTGLALDLTGGRDSFVDPCLFRVEVTLSHTADLEEVESIIEEEITAIQSDLETDLLSEARSHARYKILSQLDGPNRVASILGWYLRRGGMGALDTFYEQYDAVSASDVSEVARQYLREETRTTAILLPPLSATSKSEGN